VSDTPSGSADLPRLELRDAWLEDDPAARWRVARPTLGAAASALVYFELDPGCRLGRHRDSAEETLVVLAGRVEFRVEESPPIEHEPGGVVVVPAGRPHAVRNAGPGVARAIGVFAAPRVTSTFDAPVMPEGTRVRGGRCPPPDNSRNSM
jgi:quercetin dioxygenase-like cupin family protein